MRVCLQRSRDEDSKRTHQLSGLMVQYHVLGCMRCGFGRTVIALEAIFPKEETNIEVFFLI